MQSVLGFCCFFLVWMGAEVLGLAASRGGPAVSSGPQRNADHKTLQQQGKSLNKAAATSLMFGMLRKVSVFSLSTCICGIHRDAWRFVLLYLFTKSIAGWGVGERNSLCQFCFFIVMEFL